MTSTTKKITFAGMFLALALLLPFLTGQIPQIGNALSPMHIPVLLCGFVCGGPLGLVVGFIAPLLRYMLFGMPPIFPTGIAMAFELAIYGLAAGLLYKRLPKKTPYIYVSLILSMIIGRIVWGAAMFVISLLVTDVQFGLSAFLAGAFIKALPGIILHVVLIPVIVIALKKAKLMFNG
ncbi:MAG: ECF transporter S component [Clostridiaceae bacterium]|jgi:riboflavin transporter FmnP|nr:ECF transporter S component [Clostridiaceae bacterium]